MMFMAVTTNNFHGTKTKDIESTLNDECFNILERGNHSQNQNETASNVPETSPVKVVVEETHTTLSCQSLRFNHL